MQKYGLCWTPTNEDMALISGEEMEDVITLDLLDLNHPEDLILLFFP